MWWKKLLLYKEISFYPVSTPCMHVDPHLATATPLIQICRGRDAAATSPFFYHATGQDTGHGCSWSARRRDVLPPRPS
jgi:hypothetical protein